MVFLELIVSNLPGDSTIEIDGIGLLGTGNDQVVDANMRWQGGTIINYISYILGSKEVVYHYKHFLLSLHRL